MRVFMRGGSGRFEVLSNDRRTHTMHCRWPHNGAEFDWQYKPEWLKQYFTIETEEDDDA
jgi:hypothetical protein